MRQLHLIILTSLFAAQFSSGQDIERIQPRLFEGPDGIGEVAVPDLPESPFEDNDESLGIIHGIALVSRPEQVAIDTPPSVAGVQILDEQLIVPEEVKVALQQYVNGPLTLASVNGITRDAVLAYREAGLPVVDVGLPEQNVSTGVIQLVVVVGRVGDVAVEGNHYFSEKIYTRAFRTEPGNVIWQDTVLSDLRYLNRSPYREVGLLYTPGDDFGQTDLILSTNEIRPYSAYFGYEDTGNQAIGVDRLLFGFEWGNVGGWDHTVAYQYTTTPDFEGIHGHSLIYRMPIHQLRHELRFLAGYVESGVDIPTVGGAMFTSGGKSTQLSPTYIVPLDQLAGYEQEIQVGFDFKSTNNNLEFGGLQVSNSTAEIWQFGIGHQLVKQTKHGRQQFFHRLVWSPGELSNHNTDMQFQGLRALASSDYVYWNGQFSQLVELPNDFRFLATINGQVSNGNLLPSESLILGGIGSVRGFEQNITRADRGLVTNLELYGPAFSPLSWIQGNSSSTPEDGKQPATAINHQLRDEARFFGFFDYAVASNYDLLPAEADGINLGGIGLGLDYRLARNLSLQIAHGWQTAQSGFLDDMNARWHVSATARW